MHMPFMPCIYARTCKRIYMQYRCTSCVALCTIPNSVCRIALKFVSSPPHASQTETRDCTPVPETGPRRRSRPERGLTSDHDSREA